MADFVVDEPRRPTVNCLRIVGQHHHQHIVPFSPVQNIHLHHCQLATQSTPTAASVVAGSVLYTRKENYTVKQWANAPCPRIFVVLLRTSERLRESFTLHLSTAATSLQNCSNEVQLKQMSSWGALVFSSPHQLLSSAYARERERSALSFSPVSFSIPSVRIYSFSRLFVVHVNYSKQI